MEDWKEFMARRDAMRAYDERIKKHNAEIDLELEELDVIERHDLIPGMPVGAAQRAIMRSQVRLLKKQWRALQIE